MEQLHIFTAVLTPLLLLGIPKDRHEVTPTLITWKVLI